ncbi:MAG: hypothetical protein HY800_04610 [Ignavibacteriales bacterium]|nr:hypothetical protein [Ignavibacteriales bacterium]
MLIISFSVPFGGSYILLQYQKLRIKKEIKHRIISGIDKNELVFFKFSKTESEKELLWEHSKEFEYKGEMYDVVESEEKGDTICYWCWWDHEETSLNKRLNILLARAMEQNPQQQEKARRVAIFLQSLFSPNTIDWNAFFLFCFTIQNPTNFFYSSVNISPPIPPP